MQRGPTDANQVTRLTAELLKEVRNLHFHTRHLADQGVAGRYRSAFRGRGIEFEEVREYVPGDDVRLIDWKVTARTSRAYVKSFREERELTVMIAVDVSASSLTGTRRQMREALSARIGALLTLIAVRNNDKVGLVTFSDRIETYHPPRKARSAVWRILHEVLIPRAHQPGTDLAAVLSFLSTVLKRKAIVFVISDFIAQDFEREIAVLGKRHDVTAVLINDPADFVLPPVGMINMADPETGEVVGVDTSDKSFRLAYEERSASRRALLLRQFRKHGISWIELRTDRPFINDFKRYFDKRSSHLYQTRSHMQSL